MTRNIARALGLLVFVVAWTPFLACNLLQIGGTTNGDQIDDTDDDGSTANLAVFVDPDSDFSTRDVRDVDDEIVRFDTSAKTIIWAADGTAFQEGLWEVDGLFLNSDHFFQVRFGTKDGLRRAYFIETARGTICQIEPVGATLSISPTDVTVPQE
jgi:hypothetical protein